MQSTISIQTADLKICNCGRPEYRYYNFAPMGTSDPLSLSNSLNSRRRIFPDAERGTAFTRTTPISYQFEFE